MVAGLPSLITQEINLGSRAAQTGGALHELLLDYGFSVVEVGESTTVYQSQPDGYQVTLDAVGHWWIKPRGERGFRGIGFVDLEVVLTLSARLFNYPNRLTLQSFECAQQFLWRILADNLPNAGAL